MDNYYASIAKSLERIADALEKKKPYTINVQGRTEEAKQDRRELANTIRDILSPSRQNRQEKG